MPPIDAGTDTGPVPVRTGSTGSGEDSDDTLDLRLPEELVALIAGRPTGTPTRDEAPGPPLPPADAWQSAAAGTRATLATDAWRMVPDGAARAVSRDEWRPVPGDARHLTSGNDLLDDVAGWGPTVTPLGTFQLVPVRLAHDLPLICRWMNDPDVSAFWNLAGSPDLTAEHVRAQLDGDGRSVPCLGTLDGAPTSYWEIYRADLDPLARHYPARPHDTGIHLLVGDTGDRGRGHGSVLLRAVADLALDRRPACRRVVAEPDIRNTPSVAAFLSAGFRFAAEVDLSDKRAALMIRDRTLRALL